MKKYLVPIFLLALAIFTPPLFGKEEAPLSPLAVDSASGRPMEIPFQVGAIHELPLQSVAGWIEATPGQIFTTGTHPADFVLPSLKEDPVPIRYPRWAVQEGWEGSFVIAVEILPTGEVGRWNITQSTGYPLLDQAATEAVRKWRFHAALEQGKPVVSCIQIPIHFELEE